MIEIYEEAYTYAFPYVAMGRLRAVTLGDGTKPGPVAPNAWNHRRKLAGPRDRHVTTPNCDTAYSTLWIDLAGGPVVFSVPDTDDRYYSLAFIDMATDNFAMSGRRVSGTRAGRFVLVGPDWAHPLPQDMKVIRARNTDVMVLCRIVVKDMADLPAVHMLQDAFLLEMLGDGPGPAWREPVPMADDPASFVSLANTMLGRNPPPASDSLLLRRFAAVGIGDGGWDALSAEAKRTWSDHWPAIKATVKGGLLGIGPVNNGWRSPKPNLGNFGTDYAYRAAVALDGLLALETVEATYFSTGTDNTGEPLRGDHAYTLTLPAGVPEVGAFWSLSMYRKAADGRFFFADNPIHRYAIGDRTEGLQRDSVGAVTLHICHDEPRKTQDRANWLPAPAGDFHLVLRAYEPSAAFRDGRRPLPAVERL